MNYAEESAWPWAGRGRALLRMDPDGITVNRIGRRISWDEVSCLADAGYVKPARKWALEIVLRSGDAVTVGATRSDGPFARPEALEWIRHAARRYGIPALLTGMVITTGKRGDGGTYPGGPGLYRDPGGEPGLREWTGAEWSPFLQGWEGGALPAWSPLPARALRQQCEAARITVAEHVGTWFFIVFSEGLGVSLLWVAVRDFAGVQDYVGAELLGLMGAIFAVGSAAGAVRFVRDGRTARRFARKARAALASPENAEPASGQAAAME